MREIPLTYTIWTQVDDEDFEELNQYKWLLKRGKYSYVYRTIPGGSILMHDQLMMPLKGMEVDHRDGNRLNNQRQSNLRICTHKQNMANQQKTINCTSKFRGVHLSKKGKWIAQIDAKYLGSYKSEIDAALIYNQQATKLYGEFARLNEVLV